MSKRPTTVEGGCLCGGVRYRIDFAKDHDWDKSPHTCQCTQCRKNTDSLIYYFHAVTTSELVWLSKSSLAEYESSPGFLRGFCKTCGSPLFWRESKVDSDVELAVGSFDEEYLLGGRDAEDKPTGGYAEALVNPAADRFHFRNNIIGVTDEVSWSGTRFWEGSLKGPMK